MKRVLLLLLPLGCWPAQPSLGQQGHVRRDSAKPAARRGGEATRRRVTRSPIRAMLLQQVKHVDWDDASFGEVLEWLRSRSGKDNRVNVIPRWRALGAVGVDKQSAVTLELQDVTVAQVLDEVLDQLSGSNPLSYVGEDNTLRISTRSDFRRKLYTRTYDIAEILAQMRSSRVAPQFFSGLQLDLGAATSTPGAGLGGTGRTFNIGAALFGEPGNRDDDDDRITDDELIERIIDMIQTAIAPKSWAINGGRGTVAVIGSALIVSNSADVHQLLGGPFRMNDR